MKYCKIEKMTKMAENEERNPAYTAIFVSCCFFPDNEKPYFVEALQ